MVDKNEKKNQQNKPRRDDGGKEQQGPRTVLALTLEKIEDKKATIKATLYNSLTERVLRFTIDNTTFSDGVVKTENKEVLYSFALPDKMSEIPVKVELIDDRRVNDRITFRPDLPPSRQAKSSDVKKQKMVEIFGPIGPEKKFSITIHAQKGQDIGVFSMTALTVTPLKPAGLSTTASDFSLQADDDGVLNFLATFAKEDTQINFLIGDKTEKHMLIK